MDFIYFSFTKLVKIVIIAIQFAVLLNFYVSCSSANDPKEPTIFLLQVCEHKYLNQTKVFVAFLYSMFCFDHLKP